MHIQKKILSLLFCLFLYTISISAGERTIPVDFFVMIDKSLSMAEIGKFESLQNWVQSHLVTQMLIPGDWISIYQFYGNTDHLITLEVKDPSDTQKIVQAISRIKPDGAYTDIGQALDTIRSALAKRDSERLKILYLLTDLRHEAPWSSRYAGTTDDFEHPYLAEARILSHDNWFEITLDMDIQASVVKTSHELYESIISLKNTERITQGNENYAMEDGETQTGSGSPSEINSSSDRSNSAKQPIFSENGGLSIFHILAALAILSLIIIVVLVIRSKKPSDKDKKDTQELI